MSEQPVPITPEEQIDNLKQRVQQLEDTVHYLSNTLAIHGILNEAEASVAKKMRRDGQEILASEQQRLRSSFRIREANKARYLSAGPVRPDEEPTT
ncbi:hypothetical protein PV729_45320 [Streptomyces europaeiscabiei]|uniref:Uncharacterized protein n=2 Tax=Streptomyces europaeiscabiei TaxID=146819 RepID=A0ABU4NVV7_9ACTN|nr:hypothetical protein [Streptomyces europaeiscabiei]MDX2757847.1 hypothetical protein [Streptomyces europaeiscabiei]MDX3549730.1 hypothetical protein [Streptomyces europaeiscabiei]MDX3558796.1 hypothetical protein [Streptomyces europaeiscabiei]MDX3707071.1 hypothetical protein [Streptomyces europaeiscabiei]